MRSLEKGLKESGRKDERKLRVVSLFFLSSKKTRFCVARFSHLSKTCAPSGTPPKEREWSARREEGASRSVVFVDLLRSSVMAIGEEVDIEGVVVKQLAAPLLFLLVHFQLEERAFHARRLMVRGEGQRERERKREANERRN